MHFAAKLGPGAILEFDQPTIWKRFLWSLKDGAELTVTVEKRKRIRSLSQNSLYWKYLSIIELETGNDANLLHEYFRRIFLPPVVNIILGKEVTLPASTTKLEKHEFSTYLDKINALTGIPLPDPVMAGFEAETT